MSTTSPLRGLVFAIDCPDASALADFYARLLDWKIDAAASDPTWVEIAPRERADVDVRLAFQQIPGYRAPTWPEGPVPQQAHVDVHLPSVVDGVAFAETLGARRHPHQPSETGGFIVMLDPVGHPFCICRG